MIQKQEKAGDRNEEDKDTVEGMDETPPLPTSQCQGLVQPWSYQVSWAYRREKGQLAIAAQAKVHVLHVTAKHCTHPQQHFYLWEVKTLGCSLHTCCIFPLPSLPAAMLDLRNHKHILPPAAFWAFLAERQVLAFGSCCIKQGHLMTHPLVRTGHTGW